MSNSGELTDEQRKALLGSHLLVGITYVRPDGETVANQLQFHGTVEAVGEVVAVRRADNGEVFTLPPAAEAYEPATSGEYRLSGTGEVVTDPDFTCTLTVFLADDPEDAVSTPYLPR